MRPLLWCLGITWIRRRKIRISDVFADYKPTNKTSLAPIVVSNHVSFLDMFYYLAKNVSFLSKDTIAHAPYVGMYAVARQSLFLDRKSQEDRDKILELIKQRADRIHKYQDISPLLIFPEGTVTNGRSLMSFKRGAFMAGEPIKIYVLKYNADNTDFVCSISNIKSYHALILTMSRLTNTIEEIEFEDNFDPHYSYNKHKISPNDENAWQYVAQDVKTLMTFASGFSSVETSMRATKEFEVTSEEYNKKMLAELNSK